MGARGAVDSMSEKLWEGDQLCSPMGCWDAIAGGRQAMQQYLESVERWAPEFSGPGTEFLQVSLFSARDDDMTDS